MEKSYRLIELPEVESTNTYARQNCPAKSLDPHQPSTPCTLPCVVTTSRQTGGRGQRGNSWESSPGQNLTFSLVLFPSWMAPARQFELSMLVSVSITMTLRPLLPDGSKLKIKWPNDIYYGDKKLAGILIENSISSTSILRSVIGIGLNVNQRVFTSDAPNPVSLFNITGHETPLMPLLDKMLSTIIEQVDLYTDDPEPDQLSFIYNNQLWRRNGKIYPWKDLITNTEIHGILTKVKTDGTLIITDTENKTHEYLFKQISPVL